MCHHYLEPVIVSTSDAMIALNQQFYILDLNPAASEMLGWSAKDAVGRKCREVLHCRNLNHMELCGTSSCPLMCAFSTGKPLSHEELLIGTDSSCEVSMSVTPVDLEDELYGVFTARDMSELKVANRDDAKFISLVSHDLRAHLHTANGFIELLLQGYTGTLTEEQYAYLNYAKEGVKQLDALVEDIFFRDVNLP
jgi:two-component system phosphate regulon sensor histidine kinase PhoR